jgi:hypothetical protein
VLRKGYGVESYLVRWRGRFKASYGIVELPCEDGFSFSPLGDIVPEPFDRLRINSASGRRERGFPVLHYNPAMPVKNSQVKPSPKKNFNATPSARFAEHLPQIRRCIFHMIIQSLNRRIWGRTGRGDFYCQKAALVVEVDGDIHDLQQEEDARREKVLREMGLRIVRFRNEEVLKNLSAVWGRYAG